ncbi:hypothetical protein K6L44_16110, partial [Gluconacetobacter entanii]
TGSRLRRRAFIQHIKPLLAYLCQPQKFLVKLLIEKASEDAAFLKKGGTRKLLLLSLSGRSPKHSPDKPL